MWCYCIYYLAVITLILHHLEVGTLPVAPDPFLLSSQVCHSFTSMFFTDWMLNFLLKITTKSCSQFELTLLLISGLKSDWQQVKRFSVFPWRPHSRQSRQRHILQASLLYPHQEGRQPLLTCKDSAAQRIIHGFLFSYCTWCLWEWLACMLKISLKKWEKMLHTRFPWKILTKLFHCT